MTLCKYNIYIYYSGVKTGYKEEERERERKESIYSKMIWKRIKST